MQKRVVFWVFGVFRIRLWWDRGGPWWFDGFWFGGGRLRLSLYVVQRYVGAFGSEVREGVSCFVAEGVPRSLVVYDRDGLFIEYSSSRGMEGVATVSAMGLRWF